MLDNEIAELENKVLELEYQELKKRVRTTRYFSITPKTSAKTPQQLPANLTISRKNGHTSYAMRDASGTATVLPADRDSWPGDIRAVIDKIELADKQRTSSNRLISAAV